MHFAATVWHCPHIFNLPAISPLTAVTTPEITRGKSYSTLESWGRFFSEQTEGATRQSPNPAAKQELMPMFACKFQSWQQEGLNEWQLTSPGSTVKLLTEQSLHIETEMIWVGRDLRDHLVPTPLPQAETPFTFRGIKCNISMISSRHLTGLESSG